MSIAEKLTTIAENEQRVYDAGKQAERAVFWDNSQDGGKRTNYSGAFYGIGWNDSTFNPNYDIKPTSALNMFRENRITNLKAILTRCNASLDFSAVSALGYAFYGSTVTELPTLDISKVTSSAQCFCNCTGLTDVGFVMSEKTKLNNDTFQNCTALQNISTDGVIANNLNFQWSNKLSRASIESIMNALSATTSGYTLTLSQEAVMNAFGEVTLSDRAVGTETINGITIVTAEDGTVTLNGTATEDTTITFNFPAVAKQGETWRIKLHDNAQGLVDFSVLVIGGSPVTDTWKHTATMNEGDTAYALIQIYAGSKINNVTLTPQITAFDFNSTTDDWYYLWRPKFNWTISLV